VFSHSYNHAKANLDKFRVVEMLPELVVNGVAFDGGAPYTGGRKGVEKTHMLFAPFILNGETHVAEIIIHQYGAESTATGTDKQAYNIKSVKIKNLGSGTGLAPSPALTSLRHSQDVMSVGELAGLVKAAWPDAKMDGLQASTGAEPAAQASAIRVAKGKTAEELELYARNLARLDGGARERAGDQMGFDSMGGDFAEFERTAEKIAAVQAARIKERADMVAAARGAAKKPEAARKMGLPVDNPDALKQRVAELEAEIARLRNPDADLYRELAQEAGVALPAGAAEAANPGGELFDSEFNLSGETQTSQTAENKPLPDTGTMDMFGDETRSFAPTEMDRQNEANRDQTQGMPEAGRQRPANRLGIKQSDREMTPEQRAAEARFTDELNGRTDAENDALYNALPDAQGGRVLSADIARELDANYKRDSRTYSVSSYRPASAYINKRYQRELQKPASETPLVQFNAGGQGSGKTSTIGKVGNWIVRDTTLQDYAAAARDIDAALNSGRMVTISYVHSPVEKAVENSFFRGRVPGKHVVEIEDLGRVHYRSQTTFLRLYEKYKDNKKVGFRVLDNSGELGNFKEIQSGVDFLRRHDVRYENEESTVRRAIEASKRINPEGRQGTGRQNNTPVNRESEDQRGSGQGTNAEAGNNQVGDTQGSPLQLTQPNPPAVNFNRPPSVRPGAGVNAPETIAAFSDIVKSMGGSGVIRIGRLRQRKTLGEFWTTAGIARIRIAGDVGSAAHELAHALDQAIWGRGNNWDAKSGLSKDAQDELMKLGRDLYGAVTPNGGYKAEGFAEFIRLYLTDPEQAAQKAPKFKTWFETQIMENNPKLASAIRKAQAMGTLWFQQGARERMGQQIARRKTARERLREFREKSPYRFEKLFIEGAAAMRLHPRLFILSPFGTL
jgi:hypothetical protein